MNLAECTSALRQKDGEKTIALEEIKNAEVEFDPIDFLMHWFSQKIIENYQADIVTSVILFYV